VGEEPFDSLAAAVGKLDLPAGPASPAAAGDPPVGVPPALPPALWNLDVLDARPAGTRDGALHPAPALGGGGEGVIMYHLDTGVDAGHREFGGRAATAADLTGDDGGGDSDGDGHGTHTASTAIGALVGVAPRARLLAYRVLDGAGAGRVSALVAALDGIVAARRAATNASSPSTPPPPAVALMSLGTPATGKADAAAVRAAVRALVATGVVVVAAAGNGGPADDACDTLPAALAADGPASGVLAVAASDLGGDKFEVAGGDGDGGGGVPGTGTTPPYPFSSTGRCVSLWAPGVDVLGACGAAGRCAHPGSGRAYTFASGSSMAAPHVAGAAALFLGAHPGASPAEVAAWVVGAARRDGGVVGGKRRGRGGGGALPGTTDRVLYVGK
jgi:subtilisin family serine protease